MLLDQFTDFMILVLLVAAVISGAIGDVKDTLAIVVIVVLNAVIGFVQEFRAERAMAALKQMAAGNARVVRGDEVLTVPATELVPGDLVLLEAGNVVPADLRLIEVAQLRMDEALLTGESVTVEKICAALPSADLPLGDRRNIAHKGATATSGRARGIVVATGMATELGRIAALLDTGVEPRTPLQKRLAVFGRRLGLAVIAICVIVFALRPAARRAPAAALPDRDQPRGRRDPGSAPAVVTISLALGATRLAQQHALIRRLPAVETLGSVTCICSDKTGTLTLNRMRVVEIHCAGAATRDWKAAAGSEPFRSLFTALALSNDAIRGHGGRVTGDPTEIALFRAAADAGFDKAALEAQTPRVLELPFDSERKRMTTLHREATAPIAYTKGAPESVLPRCTTVAGADDGEPLSRDVDPRRRRAHGGGRPARARGRAARVAGAAGRTRSRRRRSRTRIRRARRPDRSAAPRSPRRRRRLHRRGHHAGDDHRRSSGDGARDRPRARHPASRRPRDDGRGARAARPTTLSPARLPTSGSMRASIRRRRSASSRRCSAGASSSR